MVNLLYLSFFVVCHISMLISLLARLFVKPLVIFSAGDRLTGLVETLEAMCGMKFDLFQCLLTGDCWSSFIFTFDPCSFFSLFCRRMRRCSPCWMRGDDQLELRDREGSRFLVRIRLSHPLQLNSPHAFTDTQYIVTYFSVYPMPHKAAIAVYLAFVLPLSPLCSFSHSLSLPVSRSLCACLFYLAIVIRNEITPVLLFFFPPSRSNKPPHCSLTTNTHKSEKKTTRPNPLHSTEIVSKRCRSHIAIPSEARSTFPASVQTHKMEFRRTNSTLQSAAGGTPGSARAAPSPTGASTPTAKTMSKASLLPGAPSRSSAPTPPLVVLFSAPTRRWGARRGETIRQNNRVNVYVRVRAFAEKERTGKAAELAVQMKDDTVDVTVPEKGQFSFTFDGCFWSNDRERASTTVKASMLEVYLDDVFDLLNHRKQLTVRNDFKNHTFAVVGSKNVTVTSYKDVLELLTKAEPLRTFAETKIHDHSSRAHTLFTLEVHTEYDEPEMKPRCARILIADLAGSERIRLAGTEDGLGFEQARNINLSLLALGSCIEAVAQRGAKANVSIPEFRNSTLTKLLKDFLGGNSVSVMMVTIAPSAKDSNLSVQTLRFADRAKQITTHAKMNVIQEEEVVEGSVDYKRREDYAVKKEALYAEFQLEQTIEQLLNRIVDLEVKRNTCTDPDMQQHLDAELAEVEKALADAEYQLTCQRQILYGPVLQLEDAVCELQTTIQKQRADHEEELERLQSEQEQRLLEMKASHKAKQTQVEAAAAEERERQRQRLAAAKDEVEGLKSLIAQLQNENRLLQKKYEDLANSSAAKERELNDNLAALRRLLDETTAVKNEETEQLTRQGLTGFSNETVAYMQRLQESLGMSEAEMKENLARFNLLRSVLCKIDQEVKVATDGVQNPSSMGLRNCAPNVERTALKE
eukprot:gene7577-5342_t